MNSTLLMMSDNQVRELSSRIKFGMRRLQDLNSVEHLELKFNSIEDVIQSLSSKKVLKSVLTTKDPVALALGSSYDVVSPYCKYNGRLERIISGLVGTAPAVFYVPSSLLRGQTKGFVVQDNKNLIVISDERDFVKVCSVIVHELTHMVQYDRLGAQSFDSHTVEYLDRVQEKHANFIQYLFLMGLTEGSITSEEACFEYMFKFISTMDWTALFSATPLSKTGQEIVEMECNAFFQRVTWERAKIRKRQRELA